MTTSARPTQYFLRADVVIGPYAVEKLAPREIGFHEQRISFNEKGRSRGCVLLGLCFSYFAGETKSAGRSQPSVAAL